MNLKSKFETPSNRFIHSDYLKQARLKRQFTDASEEPENKNSFKPANRTDNTFLNNDAYFNTNDNTNNPGYEQHILEIVDGNFAASSSQHIDTPDPLEKARKSFFEASQIFNQFSNFPESYSNDEGQKCIQNYVDAAHQLLCHLQADNQINEYNFYSTLFISTLNKSIVKFQHDHSGISELLTNVRQAIINTINQHDAAQNSTALYKIAPQTHTGEQLLEMVLEMVPNTNDDDALHCQENKPKETKKRSRKTSNSAAPMKKKKKNSRSQTCGKDYLDYPGFYIEMTDVEMRLYFQKLKNSLDTRIEFDPGTEISDFMNMLNLFELNEKNIKKVIVAVYATLLYFNHFKRYEKCQDLAYDMLKLFLSKHTLLRQGKKQKKTRKKYISDQMKSWMMNQRTPLCVAKILYPAQVKLDADNIKINKSGHTTIGIKQFLKHCTKTSNQTGNAKKNAEDKKLPDLSLQMFLNEAAPGWQAKVQSQSLNV